MNWEALKNEPTEDLTEIIKFKEDPDYLADAKNAFTVLTFRFRKDVIDKCTIVCRKWGYIDEEVAIELTQRTFERYWKYPFSFDKKKCNLADVDQCFKFYLYSIAENELKRLHSEKVSPYDGSEKLITSVIDDEQNYEPEKLIYTSTISVYKTPAALPVNEQAQTRQDSPYVITKLAAENLLRTGKSQIQTTILRLPSLYGAGQKDSFIDGLAYVAIKNQPIELYSQGKVLRDALHVSDVIEAIDLCLKKIPKDHGSITMNIGCGSPISTYHYAKALIRALNSHSMIIPVSQDSPHAHDIYADISLAKKLIGFSPMSLTVAMERYADELLEQQ